MPPGAANSRGAQKSALAGVLYDKVSVIICLDTLLKMHIYVDNSTIFDIIDIFDISVSMQ